MSTRHDGVRTGSASYPDPTPFLRQASAHGIDQAEVLANRKTRDQVTGIDGEVDLALSVDSTEVNLKLGADGHFCYVTAGGAADPFAVVEHGARLLATVHGRSERASTPSPHVPEARRQSPNGRSRRPRSELEKLLIRCSSNDTNHTEIRAWAETRSVCFADNGGTSDSYTDSVFGAMVRVTSRTATGVGHSTQVEHCGDENVFYRALLPALLARARKHARALSSGADTITSLPSVTVLDASVAAHVVGLTVESLLADAVVQRRSRFHGGLLGTRVAAPEIEMVDDGLADGPLCTPFDDEGSPTVRRTLVKGGTLAGFLSDRAHSSLTGAAPGSGWKQWTNSPLRPGPSNLLLSSEDPVSVTHRRLRIIETYGGHTANPLTGDFSFGASALIEESGRVIGPVKGLSVAGNAFDVLHGCRLVQGPHRWFSCHGGYLGCPDLLVEGLVIGQ